MPLHLLDYSVIRDKSRLPVWEERYNEFGNRVIGILLERGESAGVYQCEMIANIRIMKTLLGNEYTIRAIEKPREHPIKTLRASVRSKRLACIIEGAARYIVIHEKKLP